jgi:hypothetical protein
VVLGIIADVLTLEMEGACTSETLAACPTATQCNNPRTELIPISNDCESQKSVI